MHFRRAPKADAKLVRCMGVEYVPDLYAGFRYDDSMIGIPWPETVAALSANDAAGHC
jgi:dTDP-4-dehydrorhamnose 3,5-epimerase-like enzyme